MTLLPVIDQIIMLFIIAALGLMLRKINVFTDPVIKGINSTVLMVTWPAMIIMTTQKDASPEALSAFFDVFVAGTIIMGATMLIAFVLLGRMKEKRLRPVMSLLAALPNAGYIGLPIVQAVYGDAGALYLAAYIVGFNIVLWTLGVSICTGFTLDSLKGMLNPGLAAAAIGITLFVLGIRLPTPILSAVNQLGGLNTPLAMLLLGARMDTLKLGDFKGLTMWLSIGAKLIVIPLAALFVLRALGMSALPLGVTVLATAMPSASACQMLAEKYNLEAHFAAKFVSISTLLCIVTIPLILVFMG